MNGHPQYAEALALYAVGALDNQQDLAELESHLGTCGDCRRELEALRADTALLALSAVGPKPPERVRQRLMTAVAAEPRVEARAQKPYVVGRMRPRWFTFAPIAVMLLLAVFSMLLWREVRTYRFLLNQTRAQLEQVQAELNKTSSELAEAKDVKELLHAPDAWPLTLVAVNNPPQPQMKVIYSRQKGSLLLVANNAPVLPEDKIYELWLLPMDGSAPMPAGWFKPDSQGHGMIFHHMKSSGISAKGFAVTIEPPGGSETPTMPIKFSPAG